MSEELKPCPRCKGNHQIFGTTPANRHYIECNCGYFTPCFDTFEEAFEYWNRRADNGYLFR